MVGKRARLWARTHLFSPHPGSHASGPGHSGRCCRPGRTQPHPRREEESVPRRVERSFAFLDLCGFSDFTDQRGDDAAAEVLLLMRTVVRQVASRYGVRVDKWLGDGAMLVGVDTADLIQAVLDAQVALALSATPLGLRAGITSGEVMVFEGDDYIGRCINLAAKICDLAAPGTLLLPAELRPLCPPEAVIEEVGLVAAEGFADLQDLVGARLPLPESSALGSIFGAARALGDDLVGTTRAARSLADTIQREIRPRRRRRGLAVIRSASPRQAMLAEAPRGAGGDLSGEPAALEALEAGSDSQPGG